MVKWIGVDAGMGGIFDLLHYEDDDVVDAELPNADRSNTSWYNLCVAKTNCDQHGGVIPFGCVCKSGFGDGAYDVLVARTHGVVTAVCVDYGMNGSDEDEDA